MDQTYLEVLVARKRNMAAAAGKIIGGILAVFSLLLLPGSVYDRELGRMGYGKGFYDRFLHKFPKLTSAGLAFDGQIAKAVPVDEKDERVDMIVTETEIIRMAGREKE